MGYDPAINGGRLVPWAGTGTIAGVLERDLDVSEIEKQAAVYVKTLLGILHTLYSLFATNNLSFLSW